MLSRIDVTRPGSVVGWAVLFGIVAGLIAAIYFSFAGEPAIDDAIAIEEAQTEATSADGGHHEDEDEQVSRDVQRGAGLFGAYALMGAVFGMLLAVTAMTLRGPWLDPFRRFLVAGAVLAGAVTVAPWFKYPPNPPAVGDPDTAGERQVTYWVLIILTSAILAGAAHLSNRLRRADWDPGRRVAAVALVAALAVGLVMGLMPAGDVTIPPEVPASLVWRFRTASLLGNLLLWGLLTVGMALACAESTAHRRTESDAVAPTSLRSEA